MTRLSPILAALALTAAPALAQQASGTVSGTLDLQDRSWSVAGAGDVDGGATASDWQESDAGWQVRLAAYSDPLPEPDDRALILEFTVDEATTTVTDEGLRVTLGAEESEDALRGTPPNTDIEVTAFEADTGNLTVTGSFAGVLVPGGSDELVESDAEGAVTVDGNFQATLYRLD